MTATTERVTWTDLRESSTNKVRAERFQVF